MKCFDAKWNELENETLHVNKFGTNPVDPEKTNNLQISLATRSIKELPKKKHFQRFKVRLKNQLSKVKNHCNFIQKAVFMMLRHIEQ